MRDISGRGCLHFVCAMCSTGLALEAWVCNSVRFDLLWHLIGLSGSSDDGYATALEDSDLEDGEIQTRPHQREPEPPQGSQTSKRSASAEADDLCAKTTLTKKYKLENNGTRSTTKRVDVGPIAL